MKILLAVDGSKPSLEAVEHLSKHADWYREKPIVELLTVHHALPSLPGLQKSQAQKFYQEEGEKRLSAAKATLEAANLSYRPQILVGDVAQTIVKYAKEIGCDLIYIGTRGMGAAGNALLGSTATKVTHLSPVPVLLVKAPPEQA